MTAYPFTRYTSDWPMDVSLDRHAAGRGELYISDDFRIHRGATANSRVKIRDSLITCTGSVVTKNVEDFSVVTRNPARCIKHDV